MARNKIALIGSVQIGGHARSHDRPQTTRDVVMFDIAEGVPQENLSISPNPRRSTDSTPS